MGVDFTVYKGSQDGRIVKSSGHREVGRTQALVRLTHSGVCGTDEHYKHVDMGLGHEGVGVITELGAEAARISDLKVGDRVGMGWVQKICGYCKPCLTGLDLHCENSEQFGTANYDEGTFGTAVAWDVSALYKIPDEIPSEFAGPLMCGGATVWAPLVDGGVRPGDRIGVVGIGGLGHLAIQFASKMGLEVVVFSSAENKKEEAMKFGATEFHSTQGKTKFEGIKLIDRLLITASALPDFSLYQTVMAPGGLIFPLTISFDAAPVPMLPMITKRLSIVGSGGASRIQTREMLAFSARHNVRAQIQTFPLTQKGVTDAMQTLEAGKMRYRGVVVV